jgi:hypothetical protein
MQIYNFFLNLQEYIYNKCGYSSQATALLTYDSLIIVVAHVNCTTKLQKNQM